MEQVSFSISDQWNDGFIGNFTIRNTTNAAINGWDFEFDAPFNIANIWNAKVTSHTGSHYKIHNESWNKTIPAGGSISFGFEGDILPNTPIEPINYTLNGENVFIPTILFDDVSIIEGNAGTHEITALVKLSHSFNQAVTLDYNTTDGTAIAGQDYIAKQGSLTFAAGETQKAITLTIKGDTTSEIHDHFNIQLSNVTGAIVKDSTAKVTITNDDGVVIPSISISNANVIEGDLTTQTGTAEGFFSTRGNQIIDSNGNTVKIAGVSWFGIESETSSPHGLWSRNMEEMMDQMKATGFNTIRLPFSNEGLDTIGKSIDMQKNPQLVGLTGLELVDKIVEYAGQIGMRIILDNHRLDAGIGALHDGVWHNSEYSADDWVNDWKMLAERYAGNPTVIGADIFNEPHGPARWGNGDPATDWKMAAERAGNAIHQVNPDWLIFVEGVEQYNNQYYWWGGNLKGVADHPIQLNVANKLVYSPHDYPASVYNQPWFNTSDYPNNLTQKWSDNWGYLYEQNLYPILLGEFGSKLETTKDVQWLQKMLGYLGGDLDGNGTHDLPEGNQGISWTWWSWNPNSSDTGGILNNDWQTVNQQKVQLLQQIMFDFADIPNNGELVPDITEMAFTVTLSEPTTEDVTIAYTTADGTATAGEDYIAKSGILLFHAGETSKTILVKVLGDTVAEGTESFSIQLSNPVNGTLIQSIGTGTINDNELVEQGKSLLGTISNDLLVGNSGDDTIDGAGGDDIINGNNGNDHLKGGEGDDAIAAGEGADTVSGGKGNDILSGEGGDDVLDGNSGNDTMAGGIGNDILLGTSGNDVIYGNDGADTLNGGSENDVLYGDAGNDILIGDGGNDTIYSGSGNDTMGGGSGSDNFFYLSGTDVITDFTTKDMLTIDANFIVQEVRGGNTILTISEGNTITLIGYTSLDAAHYVLI